MSISERIASVESEFFNRNAYDPTYLILSPQAYEELKMEEAEEEGLSMDEVFLKVISTYEGLRVAITPVSPREDIVVC